MAGPARFAHLSRLQPPELPSHPTRGARADGGPESWDALSVPCIRRTPPHAVARSRRCVQAAQTSSKDLHTVLGKDLRAPVPDGAGIRAPKRSPDLSPAVSAPADPHRGSAAFAPVARSAHRWDTTSPWFANAERFPNIETMGAGSGL